LKPEDNTELWQRLEGLRPRLRDDLVIVHHRYRGVDWHLLHDPVADRRYWFNNDAEAVLRRFDGRQTLKELRTELQNADGASSPDEAELLALLNRLQAADLLVSPGPRDPAELFNRWRKAQVARQRGRWLRPLAIRLPLFDPTPLVDRLLPWVRPLFRHTTLLVWLAVVGLALLLGVRHAPELQAHGESRFLDPLNLLLLWASYPVLKGLHEFGHAFAVRRWRGQVHELGVMFLVFMPVPYVDGSAASAFADKQARLVVGAVGIMIEAFVAALGLMVFLAVEPGLLRDLCFNLTVLGGVSTLLFNGNPLLRFDGYYVLVDALEIPNLATRAQQFYGYLFKRYLFGLTQASSPVIARGEPFWFLSYGAASFVYRLVISLTIALYVAGLAFFIGLGLALWVLIGQLLLPLSRQIRALLTGPEYASCRLRSNALVFGLAAAIAALAVGWPVPANTVAEGVILLPERTLVRAGAAGEVAEVFRRDGQTVTAGAPLLGLHDAPTVTRVEVLRARAAELRARIEQQRNKDLVQAGILEEELASTQEELTEAERRVAQLVVVSPASGRLDLLQPLDLPGRYVEKGQVLGVVRTADRVTARVVVPHQRVERVRRDTLGLGVRIPGRSAPTLPAELIAEVPSGTHHLPSATLGSLAGGRVAVDARDQAGLTSLEPVFQFDIGLPARTELDYPGARVLVRFEHSREPLAPRWYRSVRQLLLGRLEI
jgi:putative peptide zinc metalloprotease protein